MCGSRGDNRKDRLSVVSGAGTSASLDRIKNTNKKRQKINNLLEILQKSNYNLT